MLPKLKIAFVGMLALFAFAAATSTASAVPTWLVNGTRVASGAKFTIAEAAAISASNKLLFDNKEIEITCSAIAIKSGWIEGFTKNGAEHVAFSSCTVAKPAHCAVTGGNVTTAEVRSHLLPSETTPQVTFEPLNGTTFAAFKLESSGGTCALNGKEFKVAGHANFTILEPTVDAVLKEISAKTAAGELTVNGEEAVLEGNISLKLLLGFIWGIA